MNDIKTRLSQIAEIKGLSMRSFEEFCHLKRGNISNILPGGSIGSDKLAKIFDAVPDVNPLWLINGIGEMFTTSPVQTQSDTSAQLKILQDINQRQELTIREQAKEIGRLEAQLEQLSGMIEKSAESANTDTIANVG